MLRLTIYTFQPSGHFTGRYVDFGDEVSEAVAAREAEVAAAEERYGVTRVEYSTALGDGYRIGDEKAEHALVILTTRSEETP
ncbi:hypothetical protein ACT17_05920 [Mycolicibacterium conceptionense]|uniref:Uncharacterized protein n=1 Tax=Mycolicibacterium conceptionense TaxID=451644 RepID=A0A0J8UF86_9MYCO|nr:hypothetical protein [Mycolicibacterium conceptionense]KMV19587.1 hypothetical protein ACT17_05920 [Mycolicibacterium conceptionense]